MAVYCLFCKTGREGAVECFLRGGGYGVIGARGLVHEPRPGRVIARVERVALPGYVFLESEGAPDWKAIGRHPDVLKPLAYDDGVRALRGRDLEFALFLKFHGGFLGLSRAMRVGTRIRIIDGPLKRYEGDIVKVNGTRLAAEVRVGEAGAGIARTIWLPYELVEKA